MSIESRYGYAYIHKYMKIHCKEIERCFLNFFFILFHFQCLFFLRARIDYEKYKTVVSDILWMSFFFLLICFQIQIIHLSTGDCKNIEIHRKINKLLVYSFFIRLCTQLSSTCYQIEMYQLMFNISIMFVCPLN